MNSPTNEMTLERLAARVSELEEELVALRAKLATRSEPAKRLTQPPSAQPAQAGRRWETSQRRTHRRSLLRKGLGVAAAVVGAGAVLQTTTGTARANGSEGPTVFSSDNSQASFAVDAIGTNGASGVVASTDSGTGVSSQSSSGTAIDALAFNFFSNAVSGRNDSGTGVYGRSDRGIAIHGFSFGSGIGTVAQNDSGIALRVIGHMQMFGNAVGKATLSAGQTSVTVSTSAATKSSNVLLTPLANPKANLWVTRAAGSFTIHASAAPSSNLTIAYLIIN